MTHISHRTQEITKEIDDNNRRPVTEQNLDLLLQMAVLLTDNAPDAQFLARQTIHTIVEADGNVGANGHRPTNDGHNDTKTNALRMLAKEYLRQPSNTSKSPERSPEPVTHAATFIPDELISPLRPMSEVAPSTDSRQENLDLRLHRLSASAVGQVIRGLPPIERLTVVLSLIGGCNSAQIADIMGLTDRNARRLLFRSRKQLSDRLLQRV